MKTFTLLFSVISLLSYEGCDSQHSLEKEPPATITKAYAQEWVSGIAEGGHGTNLYIQFSESMDSKIEMDSIYMNGKAVAISSKKSDPNLFIAQFKEPFNPKSDDGKQAKEMPFELKPDEAILAYRENGKRKYYKMQNIETTKPENVPMQMNDGGIKN